MWNIKIDANHAQIMDTVVTGGGEKENLDG